MGGRRANWRLDLADNIFDLQVALGLDTSARIPPRHRARGPSPRTTSTAPSTETADGENDDWMYNGEKITDAALFANSDLVLHPAHHARPHRPPRQGLSGADAGARGGQHLQLGGHHGGQLRPTERMYRRRILRTVIDMRNLG